MKFRRLLVTLAAVLAAIFAFSPAASADINDSGDGDVTCNVGEICFQMDWSGHSDWMRKQFWYSANHWYNSNHNAYTWWWVPNNYGTAVEVRDNANTWRNRDTDCQVNVWDIDSGGGWFPYASQDSLWGAFNSIDHYNNGHTRCTAIWNPNTKEDDEWGL